MTFVGPAFPGGPDVELQGTAQSVHAQLLKLNPNYDTDMADYQYHQTQPEDTDFLNQKRAASLAERTRLLAKRADWVIKSFPYHTIIMGIDIHISFPVY